MRVDRGTRRGRIFLSEFGKKRDRILVKTETQLSVIRYQPTIGRDLNLIKKQRRVNLPEADKHRGTATTEN